MNAFEGRFAGQTAVVTGGASGIGLAVFKRLSAEGARISVWDISGAALKANGPSFAHSLRMDQADENAVMRSTELTMREFGRIDAPIVSAGITGPNTRLA